MDTTPKANEPTKSRDGVIGPGGDKGTKGTQSYPAVGGPVQPQPQRDDPPPAGGDGQTKGTQSYPTQGGPIKSK